MHTNHYEQDTNIFSNSQVKSSVDQVQILILPPMFKPLQSTYQVLDRQPTEVLLTL